MFFSSGRLRSSLIVHTQLHTEERRYKCEICDKTFRFKQKVLNVAWKEHIMGQESNIKSGGIK